MKALFIMSLISAVTSLVAMSGFTIITFAPGPEAQRARIVLMDLAVFFLLFWLGIALWARPGTKAAPRSLPPEWLRRSLIGFSVVYLLALFVFVIA